MSTQDRGFNSMPEDKQKDIASQGGEAAHDSDQAHEFNHNEATEAGQKGGKAAHDRGSAHEFDSEEARRAGSQSHQSDS